MESGKWYLNRFLSNWGREGGTAIWPVSREDGERLTRRRRGSVAMVSRRSLGGGRF